MNLMNKNGVFYKFENEDDVYFFSTKNGMFYYRPANEAEAFLKFEICNSVYNSKPKRALHSILVINWLISDQCNCKCSYCYAKDIMGKYNISMNEKMIDEIIKNIISYNPLVVVLSGGEPLLNDKFRYIVERLYKKTGIILDTNGLLLSEADIIFLKEYEVVVRVSIDSLIPKIYNKLRPSKGREQPVDNLNRIIQSINYCLENEITTIIQTVVTEKNKNELKSMGEKFYCLGINTWKLIKLVNIYAEKKLVVNIKSLDYFREALPITNWIDKMNVVVQNNDSSKLNSVILVTPSGEFITQSYEKKIFIDEKNKNKPSIKNINDKIDLWEHRRRYIGGNL